MTSNDECNESNQEIEALCGEIDDPDINGWELFITIQETKIYRRLIEATGLYEYKILAIFPDIPVNVFCDVYMDLDYRKHWDTYVKALHTAEDDCIYWEVKYPFPLSNRDYVYTRSLQEVDSKGRTVSLIRAHSKPIESIPEKKGIVRVSDYKQIIASAAEDNGTKMVMIYYDNPGGMIPSWLVNWAAKTGVPGFLDSMNKAAKGYNDYKSKNNA